MVVTISDPFRHAKGIAFFFPVSPVAVLSKSIIFAPFWNISGFPGCCRTVSGTGGRYGRNVPCRADPVPAGTGFVQRRGESVKRDVV